MVQDDGHGGILFNQNEAAATGQNRGLPHHQSFGIVPRLEVVYRRDAAKDASRRCGRILSRQRRRQANEE
jgi:hypothetical protein